MFKRFRKQSTTRGPLSLAVVLTVLLTAAGSEVRAGDVFWDNDEGDGNLDYNTAANWDSNFGLPDGAFDEVAVIINGDAVTLNSDATADPTALAIGKSVTLQTVGSGSLDIGSGGVLDVMAGGFDPVTFPGDVLIHDTGGLTVRGTGILTATGTAVLDGNTRVVGPDATFSTVGGFTLGLNHTLTAEITDPVNHSPLFSASGTAALDATLQMAFSGPTPTIGNSWTVVDAANVSGKFTKVSGPFLPLGQAFFASKSAGGNGTLVNAVVDNQLVLNVNVGTGAASIDNLSTTLTEDINGYTITSPDSTVLNPGGWLSFQDDSQPNWEESQNPSPNILGELNNVGSRVVGSPQNIPLGTPVMPSSTAFGTALPTINFDYHLVGPGGGETRPGAVNFTGITNNLVLEVDPFTGQAQIINPSGVDVEMDGYTVASASASLNKNNWTSFQDDGQPGWHESTNPSPNILGELNLTGSRSIAKLEGGAPIPLGAIFIDGVLDLEFQFNLVDGGTQPGDLDGDGDVDGNDLLTAQLTDPSFIPTVLANYGSTGGGGGGPSGPFTGIVQYRSLTGPLGAAVAAPEPSSCLLAGLALVGLGLRRRS